MEIARIARVLLTALAVLATGVAEAQQGKIPRVGLLVLGGPAPMRYRRSVLEPGGSVSANDLVKNFLGREQKMDAFQKWMGEEFAGQERAGK